MQLDEKVNYLKSQVRRFEQPKEDDAELGPLRHLPGVWKSQGRGWNLIALPFATANSPFNYRLLLNQYDETLEFSLVDKAVPNRGIRLDANGPSVGTDQLLVTLDYQQQIHQIAAEDSPVSGQAGAPGIAIHHEPGLFLFMANETSENLNVARLATIPHGDSVLALGRSTIVEGLARIPEANALPIGVTQDLTRPYLAPYKHFVDTPFVGVVAAPGFEGFNPIKAQRLLELANENLANEGLTIVRTTVLPFNTKAKTFNQGELSGGILNIPFIVKQANAAEMDSTFWIQELKDEKGNIKFRLQYLQTVMLDFFPRLDGQPGAIRWPHISINTLEKDVQASKEIYSKK